MLSINILNLTRLFQASIDAFESLVMPIMSIRVMLGRALNADVKNQ